MEGKELLDFLGIEATNLDEFKAGFSKKYYTEKQIHDDKELLGKFTGKTLKRIKQAILNKAREKEIPFTQAEFDSVDTIEDVFDSLAAKQAETFTTKLTDLQSQVGKGDEEKIKSFTEKIGKYEQSLLDEKKAKQEIASQFETFKKETEGKIKSTRIDYFRKDLMSSIPYDVNQMKDPLKAKGWESHVAENFRFDFDEHDQPVILDKTGSKIKNPKKADEWLSPKDVLVAEADKLGLIPKNPQGGQPAFRPAPPVPVMGNGAPPVQPNQPATPNRNKIAPGMEKYLSK